MILLSRCYTKQYGEVIEAVKKKLSLPDASTDYKVTSTPEASAVADDFDKPFMSADKARELAENSLNIKERVALRIEDAAKSGEFETYLTQEEFKICELDLVEQGYVVLNNKIFWDE